MRRHPSGTADSPGSRLTLDVMAFVMVVSSCVLSYFIFTQAVGQDLLTAVKASFMAFFALSALIFRPIALGGWNFRYLDPESIVKSVAGAGVALVMMLVAVIAPQAQLAAVDFPARLFYANMGIVEEVFFNYFIFAWVASIYPWPVAALITGGFFAPFHLGVYGWDPQFMLIAILARFVLCAAYWYTGSLSSAMGAHVAFNVMATPGAIMTSAGAVQLALALGLLALSYFEGKWDWRNIRNENGKHKEQAL